VELVIPKQLKKQSDQIAIRLDRDVFRNLEHYCRYWTRAATTLLTNALPSLSQAQAIRGEEAESRHRRDERVKRSRSATGIA